MLKDYQKICEILKYDFKNPKLLEQALTHCSKEAGYSYECLEFLGDSVLGFLVSAYLYHTYPNANEGTLTSFRMHLVREEYLASWARKKGLGNFIVLGKGEENSSGREKNSILCDITESIIGAVYLDGGIGEAGKAGDAHHLLQMRERAGYGRQDRPSDIHPKGPEERFFLRGL